MCDTPLKLDRKRLKRANIQRRLANQTELEDPDADFGVCVCVFVWVCKAG